MTCRIKLVTLVTIFLFLLVIQFPSQTKATSIERHGSSSDKLLKRICNKTIDPTFCIKAFNSDSGALSTTKLLAIAKIGLKLGAKDSSNTLNLIRNMISHTSRPKTKAALEKCLEQYKLIASTFKMCTEEVGDDAQSANYDVWLVTDYIKACKNALVGSSKDQYLMLVPQKIQRTEIFQSIGLVVTNMSWK